MKEELKIKLGSEILKNQILNDEELTDSVSRTAVIDRIALELEYKSSEELSIAVADNKISLEQLKTSLVEKRKNVRFLNFVKRKVVTQDLFNNITIPVIFRDKKINWIKIKNKSLIYGEDIVGIPKRIARKDVTLEVMNIKDAIKQKTKHEIVPLTWKKDVEPHQTITTIEIDVDSRENVLTMITERISNSGLNIRAINFREREDQQNGKINITLDIEEYSKFKLLIKAITKLEFVNNIKRIK